jgi:hypothetical protein
MENNGQHIDELLHLKIGLILTAVLQLVFDFTDLHHEVTPFLAVKREDAALFVLLSDNQIGLTVSIGTACKIAEIAF